MAEIRTVCVYCGSSPGSNPVHVEAARKLGAIFAAEGIHIVYGGGGIGLMGALSDAALRDGGKVTGIIPDFLVARERALAGERTIIVTRDMHERKIKMFQMADAFVTMAGGIGTLEELIEQLSWMQLGRHRKPILLLDMQGFWNPLVELFEHQIRQGFIRRGSFEFLLAKQPEDVVPMLRKAARDIPVEELHGPAAQVVAEEM